jgi:redox-sensing transcriptional repressor
VNVNSSTKGIAVRYRRIPDETVRRLPVYLRELLTVKEQGRERISSRQLAESLHVKSPVIRKDFSYFGVSGLRGVGYDTESLSQEIRGILKLNGSCKAALVGLGHLGHAILGYQGFGKYGLEISAIFDNSREKVGKIINGIRVSDTSKLWSLKQRKILLAIIAVPAEKAQEIADRLVAAGIKGILNFAPYYLDVPRTVKVINIDIAIDLARLPYYVPQYK